MVMLGGCSNGEMNAVVAKELEEKTNVRIPAKYMFV
jgi:uncharacterized protein YoaH (UPF0181 family)